MAIMRFPIAFIVRQFGGTTGEAWYEASRITLPGDDETGMDSSYSPAGSYRTAAEAQEVIQRTVSLFSVVWEREDLPGDILAYRGYIVVPAGP